MYTGTKQIDGPLKKTESFFDEYLGHKAPPIPPAIKNGVVKFGPWVLVVLLIIGFFSLFTGIGVLLVSLPAMVLRNILEAIIIVLYTAISAISFILLAIAVPGLFKMKKKSWYLVYYATLLGFISSLLMINIVGGILFTLLGLYILFQIKPFYRS